MNNNRMIQIMVFEPGRAPYTTMLEDSLEHRQELVGGDIECIPLPCETVPAKRFSAAMRPGN